MKESVSPVPTTADTRMHERILGAAFKAFTEHGYADTSTLDIATRAKISKRDLYANFSSKHAMLVACIKARADRMRPAPELPAPRTRQMLASALIAFATNLVRETCHPTVIAMFRLAIAEATRSPEIARTLDSAGRAATRGALVNLLAGAQSNGLLAAGEPAEMARQFLGLIWQDLMVGLLLGVVATPAPAEAERRATRATDAFMRLHPDPVAAR
jgi:AcrR family transcriptional regulator